jgi:uncharacterized protein YjbI with pentapeptide repeats
MPGVSFERANLDGAILAGADLQNAKLRGASLRGADLSKANLIKADLTDAMLEGANLAGATLRGTVLVRAGMRTSRLTELAEVPGGAVDTETNFYKADLTSADLTKAPLGKASMVGVILDGAIVIGADLCKAPRIDLKALPCGNALTRAHFRVPCCPSEFEMSLKPKEDVCSSQGC